MCVVYSNTTDVVKLLSNAFSLQVDSPISPGERGVRHFLSDIDDGLLQQHREQLFSVSKDNLVEVAKK